MKTYEDINYGMIEAGVRDLCRALNESGLPIRTLWSCEGHRPSVFGQIRPNEPFVIFHARAFVVKALQTALFRAKAANDLHLEWIVTGSFLVDYGDLKQIGRDKWEASPENVRANHWQWWLKPATSKSLGFLSFGLERRLRADLAKMPGMLAEALDQPSLLQEAEKRVEHAVLVGQYESQNHREDDRKPAEAATRFSLCHLPNGIGAPAVGAGSLDVGSNPAAAYTAGHQRRVHCHLPECIEAAGTLARRGFKRKAGGLASVLVAGFFLSACVTDKEVELQKDGSGTDEPLASPCAGAPGSPCSPIPYSAPGFTWGRG